ncbi:MAG: alkaline phosphatase [Bacteroidota bacterium]
MRNQLIILFATILIALLISCNSSKEIPKGAKAKNIILLIGDGMGLSQVSSAYYFSKSTPNFSRFKYIGLHQNEPTRQKITDSAAGATAFAIGRKTYNGAIGVDNDSIPRQTILEWAAKKSKSTGVVASSSITHATPASFYAHVINRNRQEEIAEDFVVSPVDFAAGGGSKYFNERKDGKDLIQKMRDDGAIVNTESMQKKHKLGNRYVYLLEPDSMHSILGGRGNFLPKATKKAIDFLSKDEDGFFLMVEGSQIDWGGHANRGRFVIEEVKDFDEAIGEALDFAKKDGNTLVIVTADHETGGFSLSAKLIYGQGNYNIVDPTFSTGGHTAALIPVFAYGPGAENFIGIYQNNKIYDKMKNSYAK